MTNSLLARMECSACPRTEDLGAFGTCSACGAPLLCRYEAGALESRAFPSAPARTGRGVFRWSDLLPVREASLQTSLGEGDTSLLPLPRLAAEMKLGSLWVKDEGVQAFGASESRGFAVAVAAHRERGARALTLAAAGLEAAAAAAYSRAHDMACRIALPSAANPAYRSEARLFGARLVAVTGDLGAADDWVDSHPGPPDDHDIGSFREPFRIEGRKTMAFEIWERLGEELPDLIAVPCGSGTGLVALDKGFAELRQAGLLRAATPRFLAAQADACAPLVRAFDAGAEEALPWEGSRRTMAEGLRVPRLPGGRLVLAALRAGGGSARAIPDVEILGALRRVARSDSFLPSPEGAVAFAALFAAAESDALRGARVVVINSSSIASSPEALAAAAVG